MVTVGFLAEPVRRRSLPYPPRPSGLPKFSTRYENGTWIALAIPRGTRECGGARLLLDLFLAAWERVKNTPTQGMATSRPIGGG